jgi:hypothetical protein
LCIKLLVQGNSVRSTERITGVHRDTILRLLETVGERCLMLQETLVKGVKVANVEADEIWSYVGMKQKTANKQGLGDDERLGSDYTFTAIEKDSKLIVAWHLGLTRRKGDDTMCRFCNAINGRECTTNSPLCHTCGASFQKRWDSLLKTIQL